MTEIEAKAKDCIENHTHKLVDKPTKQDIYLREESIFISGYKLGATENGIQWHDLRKNPDDLPKEILTVLINAYDYGVSGYYIAHRICGKWWSNVTSEIFTGVIAWCEIPQFKGE